MFKEKRTSCISLKEVDYPPQWMFKIKNQSLEKLFKGKNISRRQDAEKIYQPNGMIYILHKKHLDEKIIFPKKDTCHIKMSQDVSINIDTEIQYQLAKTIAEKNVQKKK